MESKDFNQKIDLKEEKTHLTYQYGFGNHFNSECLPGALPK